MPDFAGLPAESKEMNTPGEKISNDFN